MVAQMCGDSSFAPFPNSHCGAGAEWGNLRFFQMGDVTRPWFSTWSQPAPMTPLGTLRVNEKKSSQSVDFCSNSSLKINRFFSVFFFLNPSVLRKPSNGRIHPSLDDFSEAFGDFGFGRIFFLQQFCTFERSTNKKKYPSFWVFFHLLFQAGKCQKRQDSRIQTTPLHPAAVQDRLIFFSGRFFFSVDSGLVMARETRGLVPGTKGSCWGIATSYLCRLRGFNQMMVIVKESNPPKMPKIWRFRNHLRPICPDTLSFSIVVTELFHGWCCRYLPKKVAEKALLIFEAWTVALNFSMSGIPVTTILTGDLSCRNSGDLSHGLMILW